MIGTILGAISKELKAIGVPYEFMRWTSDVQYPYFVGEYSETITDTEDGYNEYTMILTGTTKNAWLELEECRAKIKDHFTQIGGLRIANEEGVVVIFYDNSFPVPTGEADLKRIQINLHIKTWKGMK